MSLRWKIVKENRILFKSNLKKCSICKKILSLSEYSIRKDRKQPISRCKKCNTIANKKSWNKLSKREKQKRDKKRREWYAKKAQEGNLKVILQHKLNSFKGNAKKKEVPFNLTVDYLITLFEKQKGKCYYTGTILEITSGIGNNKKTLITSPNQFSLDRLEPKKGYIKENVVWCTYIINTCKNMLTEYEFYEMCKKVLKIKDQKCQDSVFGGE